MPTYEFRCPTGHGFDRFYKTISTAPSEVACPECGAIATRQLSAGAGLHFKGSGFYLTDYGKNAHRGVAPDAKTGGEGKADGAKSEAAGGGDTKAESPAPKPESGKDTAKPAEGGAKPKAPSPKPKSE